MCTKSRRVSQIILARPDLESQSTGTPVLWPSPGGEKIAMSLMEHVPHERGLRKTLCTEG